MSAEPARFTFDLDLGDSPDSASFMSEGARAALQQQARSDGYAQGFAAGEAGAAATAAQALAAAANLVVDRASQLLAGLDAARNAAEREAVDLAAAVAKKLAASLLAEQPAAELEALLAECLASLGGAPHLAIRCHPDLAARMKDVAAARAASSGFGGRLIVIGEPDIALGNGRIEWADGGLVRDKAAIEAAIDASIATYLEARRARPKTEETAP